MNVIISGGSKGLGKAFVSALLEDGHRVATFSRKQTEFVTRCQKDYADRFFWSSVDGADRDAVKRFVLDEIKRSQRVDILINNAAIAGESVIALAKPEEVNQILAVNLGGTIHLTEACSRIMLRQNSGVILNITSIIGLRGYAGLSVYASTKGGMDAFTRSLARELGPRGIRVNSVAPGYLETELSGTLSDAQKKQIERRTPLGRLGTVDDVVGMIRFLISPAASWITGQVFVIDGGFTC